MADNAEEWLATEDPTEGDLPTTEFIGSAKDLSQSVEPEEGDGTEIPEVETPEDSEDAEAILGAPETEEDAE
jgi:hypothetical protein